MLRGGHKPKKRNGEELRPPFFTFKLRGSKWRRAWVRMERSGHSRGKGGRNGAPQFTGSSNSGSGTNPSAGTRKKNKGKRTRTPALHNTGKQSPECSSRCPRKRGMEEAGSHWPKNSGQGKPPGAANVPKHWKTNGMGNSWRDSKTENCRGTGHKLCRTQGGAKGKFWPALRKLKAENRVCRNLRVLSSYVRKKRTHAH